MNTEIRAVGTSQKGVTFALVDEGACMTLLGVRVYYIQCDSTTANMARFSATPAAPQAESVVEVKGDCLEHSGARVRDNILKLIFMREGNFKNGKVVIFKHLTWTTAYFRKAKDNVMCHKKSLIFYQSKTLSILIKKRSYFSINFQNSLFKNTISSI